MYQKIIDYIKDKNLAILGFGREGKSTYKFIREELPNKKITILDQNKDAIKDINDNNLFLVSDDYLSHVDDFELVVKTPGISIIGREYKTEITSEFDLLLRFIPSKVIGITGTKGKSTTSSLIYKMIHDQKENSFYVGNIGIPIFDYIKEFNEESLIIAEMSAYQLNDLHISPYIGIILNLYEEHLDYFHTLDNYYSAKLNMFKYQNNDSHAIYYSKNEELNNRVNNMNIVSNKYIVDSIDGELINCDDYVYDISKGQKLIGKYNMIDIAFALRVAKILNLDMSKAEESIRNFEPLDHRMKLIAKYKEISFYDDTLATIPNATLNSIESLENIDTVIIGGLDRRIDYTGFTAKLNDTKVSNIILMPETGIKFYEELKESNKNIYYIEELEEAVKKAYEVTKKGCSVLLSPAAPSYNKYKNYEEKSKYYLEYIEKYKN